jgi:hypothetical protein
MEPFFSLISEEDIAYWKQKVLIFVFSMIVVTFFFMFVTVIMLSIWHIVTALPYDMMEKSYALDFCDGVHNILIAHKATD